MWAFGSLVTPTWTLHLLLLLLPTFREVRSSNCRAGVSAAGCSHCRTDWTNACASGWLSPPSPGEAWGCTSYYSRSSRRAQTVHKTWEVNVRDDIRFDFWCAAHLSAVWWNVAHCAKLNFYVQCATINQCVTEVCWAWLIKCHSLVNPLPAESWHFRQLVHHWMF